MNYKKRETNERIVTRKSRKKEKEGKKERAQIENNGVLNKSFFPVNRLVSANLKNQKQKKQEQRARRKKKKKERKERKKKKKKGQKRTEKKTIKKDQKKKKK